jgi:CheY-like chemotaxis protein
VEALSSDSEGALLKFSVQDTGIGIAPQQLGHLFEAFAQADSSNTRRYGGTGLGLAISRRLAQMLGGEIGANSRPGQGSTFWFTARLRWGQVPALANPPAALVGRRVLLVDDLPDACEALATLLRATGMRVDTATSGAQALQLAQATRAAGDHHDLALVDWRMPGLDSSALAAQLREQDPALLLALLTAYDEPAMWRAAQAGGYQQVLVKPVASPALRETLVRLFQAPSARAETALPDAAHGPNAQRLQRAHQGARVLVAEDNPISLEVLGSLLESCALTVLPATDGAQAVALAQQELVDLILMDVNMPGLDGLSAVRAIRRLPQHAHTPILAVTANAFDADRQAALAAGMNGHIAKPIDAEELFGQLLRWLPDSTRRPEALPAAVAVTEAQAAPGPLPPAVSAEQLARLRALLSAGDYVAVDLWRELAPAMNAQFGEQARQLGHAISRFAYAQAQQQLDALSAP